MDVEEGTAVLCDEIDLGVGQRSHAHVVPASYEFEKHHVLGQVAVVACAQPDDAVAQSGIDNVVFSVGAQALFPTYIVTVAAVDEVGFLHKGEVAVDRLRAYRMAA